MKRLLTGLFLLPLLLDAQITALNGAISAYPFCGNALDVTGTNHGQVVGASLTADRFGNAGNAYYFNGQPGCYINLGTSASLKPQKGSISVWARPDAFSNLGSGYQLNPIILTKNQPGNNCYEGYAIGLVNWSSLQFHTTQTEPFCNQSNIIYPNVALQSWYHIVMTWDNDSVWLYINGTFFQRTVKGYTSAYLSTDSVMVGNSANVQNDRFFFGAIDDLVIFGTRITQAQVTNLYLNTGFCAGTGIETASFLPPLVVYPNPATGGLLFVDGLSGEGTFEIFSVSGELVRRQEAERELDISLLRAGLYFLRYTNETGSSVTKFLVE